MPTGRGHCRSPFFLERDFFRANLFVGRRSASKGAALGVAPSPQEKFLPRVEHHLVQQDSLGVPLVPHAIHLNSVSLDRPDDEKLAFEAAAKESLFVPNSTGIGHW